MKKIFLLLSFIFCFASSYGGNTKPKRSDPKVKFGVEAGLNFPTIILNQRHTGTSFPSDYQFALTWHAGVYSNIRLSEKFDFLPGLYFSVKGCKFPFGETIGSNTNETIIYHYNYVEMPLQLKYNIGKHFFLVGGPYLGYLVAYSYSSPSFNSNNNHTRSEQTKLDIGSVIGIGFKIANGFNFAIKYSQGLRPIINKRDPLYDHVIPSLHLVLSACVGWDIKW